MFHLVARAAPGHLLFDQCEDANALWRTLARAFPELVALCLMPDHIHLVVPDPPGQRLGHAMSAYSQGWAARHRRIHVRLWAPHPPEERIPDASHLRRTVRYVLLNPCRANLVTDPLAWPWSTHRDRVRYASPAVGPVEPDVHRFHRYVSGDPSVAVDGTALPRLQHATFALEDVADAAMAVFRAGPDALVRRTPARAALVCAAWIHGLRDVDALSARTSLGRRQVFSLVAHLPPRGAELADDALAACVNATGDRRLGGWPRLRALRGWSRYANRAGRTLDPWCGDARVAYDIAW